MNPYLNVLLWITYLISLYFSVFWFLVFLENRHWFKKGTKKSRNLIFYPFVSIITPAWNEEETIQETIQSALDLDYPNDRIEIIIVNDGSTDNTEQKIRDIVAQNKERDITVISRENKGKSLSLNEAIEIAKGEFFACLDADSKVEPETLKKMVHMFQAEGEKLAIVTPAMRVKSPKNLVQKMQRIEYIISMFVARLMSHLDCLYVAPGAFSLYRKKVIQELGGFDHTNITEDQEIVYRIQKHQYKAKQCFDGFVFTNVPKTPKKLFRQRNRWYKGSLVCAMQYRNILMNKKYGDFGIAQMSINLLVFFLCTSTILFASYYMIWPLLKGFYNLALVGFDILPYLQTLTFKFNPLALDVEKMLVVYILLGISFIMLYLAHKNCQEKVREHGFFYLVPYFLAYYVCLSLIAVIIMAELTLGKKQKW